MLNLLIAFFLSTLLLFAQTPFPSPGGPNTGSVPSGGVSSIAAGTGISVDHATGAVTVTNTAPGASPAGSAGCVQLYGTSTTLGCNPGLFDSTKLGLISTATVNSALSTCTTTANMTGDLVAVGAGCQFTANLGVGSLVTLSSDPSTFCTVSQIVSDLEVMLDNNWWGDSCGDGTSQTITIYPPSFTYKLPSGSTAAVANNLGQWAFGANDNTNTNTPAIPSQDSFLFVNQWLSGNLNIGMTISVAGTGDPKGLNIQSTGTGATSYTTGQNVTAYYTGSGTARGILGNAVNAGIRSGMGGASLAYAVSGGVFNNGSGPIAQGAALYAVAPGGMGPITTNNGVYIEAQCRSGITNCYDFWADEQGVFRIRADNTFNSVYQAIPALYNPQFTKYTPGATNFERCIPGCQWESNVAVYGNEAGGTGALRETRFKGLNFQIPILAFANIATPSNAAEVYCPDCTVTSGVNDTCVGSGSGAWAQRINGVWSCRF